MQPPVDMLKRLQVFFHALLFVLGFSLVFVIGWGGAATFLGQIFGQFNADKIALVNFFEANSILPISSTKIKSASFCAFSKAFTPIPSKSEKFSIGFQLSQSV